MLFFLHPRVVSRVADFPVASPCLWGKPQNLPFSNVSTQVVMSFCVAGVALCDIPTCLITCRKCQNWRKSRTKCWFFCIHVSCLESLVLLHTPHSSLHTLHSSLYTPHSTLCTLHSSLPTLHSTLHTLHSTLYTSYFTLYTLHSILHTLHFTLRILHFTHSTLPTPHFTLHTLHFPLHTADW